jgi:hypothetical protein
MVMMNLMLASLFLVQSEELAEAAKKAAAMESYAFKVEVKSAKGKNQPGAIEVRVQKDQPFALKSGAAEGFRKGGAIVYKDGEEWKRVEKADKGEKKSQPAAASFATVKLVHEELEGFEKSFEKVEKAPEKDKDCTVWSGTLTPTAARILVTTGGKSDAKNNATYSGTAKVWVNAEGHIVRYEVVSLMKGESPKKGPVEVTTTKTVEILERGATKIEVPEAAAKLLNSPS